MSVIEGDEQGCANAPEELQCRGCMTQFESRNQLFKHIGGCHGADLQPFELGSNHGGAWVTDDDSQAPLMNFTTTVRSGKSKPKGDHRNVVPRKHELIIKESMIHADELQWRQIGFGM